MDPQTIAARVSEPSPVVRTEAGVATVEEFRPRTKQDYKEEALSVSETTVALRKEELLRILIQGKKTRQAAEVMGLGINTVRTYIRCPEFQMKLWNQDQRLWARVDEEIRQSKLSNIVRIQEMSELALEKIQALMQESEDETIVLRASQDVLDRNPDTSKRTKQDTTSMNIVIDPAQLILAAQAAREMEARTSGNVINARANLNSDSPAESQ